jgi:hypothetical protein
MYEKIVKKDGLNIIIIFQAHRRMFSFTLDS